MGNLIRVALGSALIFSSFPGQSQTDRVLQEREKWLDRASRLPGQAKARQSNRGGLGEELDDDPTISAASLGHEPPPAARKAAERAERLAKKGQHDKAIAEFQRALALDAQYYEAENNLALEYKDAGQLDQAVSTLKHLTESAPTHVLAFNNLAALLCESKRYAEAEAVERQAIKLHPFSFKANLLLATALIRQGRWTPEAKLDLQYAEAKYPEAKALLDEWPVK
jgi:tetratricopeptide (TPR) repeat protein